MLAVDLGNGFARHARLQKAADAAVLAASYVYDENHPAEMYRVAEQYLQANLDNEEDRALSLDEIRKNYDMKLYGRKAQDSTKTAGGLADAGCDRKDRVEVYRVRRDPWLFRGCACNDEGGSEETVKR